MSGSLSAVTGHLNSQSCYRSVSWILSGQFFEVCQLTVCGFRKIEFSRNVFGQIVV